MNSTKPGTVTRKATVGCTPNGHAIQELIHIDIPDGLSGGLASRYADMIKWNIECSVRNPKTAGRFFTNREKYDKDDFNRLFACATGATLKIDGDDWSYVEHAA